MMHTTANLKSKDSPFSIVEQRIPYDVSLQSEFGFVSNDSLLNPSEKHCYLSCRGYNSLLEFDSQQVQDQGAFKPFMIEWPKDQSNHSATCGPRELKLNWTQLSMSIPMPSDFSSSASAKEDMVGLSQLRLSHDVHQPQMGLGMGTVSDERGTKPYACITIALGNVMGGPLAEVLNKPCNPVGGCKSKEALSWDLLQQASFRSLALSHCQTVAQVAAAQEGASPCDDVLCTAHRLVASSSSLPSVYWPVGR